MIVLAWLCALFFAVCGLGLVVSGFYTSGVATAIAVVLGLVVASGSIPFVRSARRMRQALRAKPLDASERTVRRHKTKAILGYCILQGGSGLFLPVPGVLRAVMVVTALLVAPLLLIAEIDNARRR